MTRAGYAAGNAREPTYISMNRTRAHASTRCSACRSDELISVSLQDGEVQFWTCTLCESTGWQRDGSEVSRDSVISRIPRR